MLARALRLGDKRALTELVRRHQHAMIRVARNYVRDVETAEEVVQEAWLVVFQDIARYKARGSLKNWIFAILVNLAKARGIRESRTIPVHFTGASHGDQTEQQFDPSSRRRRPPREAGEFPWGAQPHLRRSVEDVVCDRGLVEVAVRAIEALPLRQRAVIYLRDIRGLSAEEVSAHLEISGGAQRVFLHRARTRVSAAVRGHLDASLEHTTRLDS